MEWMATFFQGPFVREKCFLSASLKETPNKRNVGIN
jgi:hypothetical protein